MNRSLLRIKILISFFLIVVSRVLFAEGTKQLIPTDADHGKIQVQPGFNNFAWYSGASPGTADYRLYIHVENLGEIIYYGFGDVLNSNDIIVTDVQYRIWNPAGTVVVAGPATVPASGAGYIPSFLQAVAGPAAIVGISGYTALSYTPTVTGDYFIEFNFNNGFGGHDRTKFKYFDVTVASAANVAIDGRLWSKAWQMTTDNYGNHFLGKMYVYTSDSVVTSINFNSMDPFVFTVACNQYGCYNTGNFINDRRSVTGNHTFPQFKIFLNDPDINVYPTGILGSVVPPITVTPHCNGTADIQLYVTKGGTVQILLNINPLPGVQAQDVQLTQAVTGGWNTIMWNGLNGLGQPVPNGMTFDVFVTYISGLTNLPIYDVESNPNGFIVQLTRPSGTDPKTYWYDLLVGGGQNLAGCNYSLPATGCHSWVGSGSSGIGESNTVNTWWYVDSTTSTPVNFITFRTPEQPGAITGPSSICPGATGQIFWIHSTASSSSYTWGYTGTGATITQVSDTVISVNFSNVATSGNITVFGTNSNCGNGTSQTKAVTINPTPVVSLAAYTPVCVSAPAFTLTGGTPAGGTYWIGGVQYITFNPAAMGVGTHNVTYIYTDPTSLCTSQDTKPLVVNPLPTVTFAPLTNICQNAPSFTLSGGAPAGGTYSGAGVSGGVFNPATAGAGTFNITYSYTNANFCTNTAVQPITVYPIPAVTLAALSPVCINAPAFALAGGSPAGGVYSGPGVTAGVFNPATAGAGTFTIWYKYTSVNGCKDSASKPITVNPLPVVTLAAFSAVCISAPAFPLTGGLPAGGTYWIGGVQYVNFNPAVMGAGTFNVTYIYTSPATSCTSQDTKPLVVNPLPVVSFAPLTNICANSPSFVLTGGLPAGGTYSGTGVSGGIFNPATAGPGTFNITYTYTNANLCTNTAVQPITVYPKPTVTLAALNPVCQNIPPFALTGGNPAGGIYWGPGVSAGTFDPGVTGPGTFTIWYVYTSVNGCKDSASKPMTVNPLPGTPGSITGTAVLCQGSTGISYFIAAVSNALTYSWTIVPAAAGTITGNTTSITISWSAAYSGTASLTVAGINNCGAGASSPAFSVLVHPRPVVSFIMCTDSITTPGSQVIKLKEGIPLGGTYSGTGVNSGNSTFNPATAGLGTHSISYSYTNVNGCSSAASRTITVTNPGLFTCGGNLKDVRDNKLYKTVLIGAQCWMEENLNYGSSILSTQVQLDNCIPEKYCYGENPSNCTSTGGLYQWDEIMDYNDVMSYKGICPPGWHIPSENEWNVLFSNYINNGFAANALKATGYSGFNALVTGVNFYNQQFGFSSFASLFWSSNSHGPYKAWAHGMNSFDPSVSFYPSSRSNAFSVRCIKD